MIVNDEPGVHDRLQHNVLVQRVGHRVLKCTPPYVIGVCGSWGAGKTSFLFKLWAYLDGEHEKENGNSDRLTDAERSGKFQESASEFQKLIGKRKVELVWFNPWQHQFESSPMVALLNEVRDRLSTSKKILKGASKTSKIGMRALFDSVVKLGAEVGGVAGIPKLKADVQLPTASSVIGLKREYDSADFSAPLVSQQFRNYFESAIKAVAGENGLLVIFIDDLDRCEGDVAYKLLEALKLHLNARNCVFVLGLDQQQLENAIAKAFSGDKEDRARFRPMARDYLSKMFQGLFLLPVPRQTETYVEDLLDFADEDFSKLLKRLFEFDEGDRPKLIQALDQNLPHNPRKIKSFINSWKLYLESFPKDTKGLDWRLTVILHYLAQFEEPIFRKVEESPEFYNQEVLPFCRSGFSDSWRFDGLRLPHGITTAIVEAPPPIEDESGGSTPVPSSAKPEMTEAEKKEKREREITAGKWHPGERVFWISQLIMQVGGVGAVSNERILNHLLHTGIPAKPQANAN